MKEKIGVTSKRLNESSMDLLCIGTQVKSKQYRRHMTMCPWQHEQIAPVAKWLHVRAKILHGKISKVLMNRFSFKIKLGNCSTVVIEESAQTSIA